MQILSRFTVRVTLAAVIVCGCLGFAGRALAQEVKIQRLGGGRFMTETVREAPGSGLQSLNIIGPENLGGAVTVTAKPGEIVRMELLKIFKVGSEAEAVQFERNITYTLRTTGSTLELEISTNRDAPWEGREQSARVELSLTIPESWDIEIRGRFLEMDLTGPFRRADVQTEFGRIKLTDVAQKTRLSGSYTAIEILNVKGDISAQTSFADLVVRNCIPAAEHPARLSNQNGSIVIDKLAGAVIAESENAPILLTDVVLLGSGSSLRTANAMVKADVTEFSDADLDIRNSNGVVILRVPKNLSARLNCSVGTGGSIQTAGFIVQTHSDLLDLGRLEGIIGAGRGIIDIDVTGPGQIGIQGI